MDHEERQQEIVEEPDSESLASLERLESRILNTIEQLRESRRRQAQAEENAAHFEGLLSGKEQEIERLTAEIEEIRSERREVTRRIESLLNQIDAAGEA